MEQFFEALERHPGTAIAVGIFICAVITLFGEYRKK